METEFSVPGARKRAHVPGFGAQKEIELCGFGLRNRGPVLHFWDLRTGSAAGFLGSEMGAERAGLGAKSRSRFGWFAGGWEGTGGCGGKQGMGRLCGPSPEVGVWLCWTPKFGRLACTRPNSMSEMVSGRKGAFQAPHALFESSSSLYAA